jgi:hypothetical protein
MRTVNDSAAMGADVLAEAGWTDEQMQQHAAGESVPLWKENREQLVKPYYTSNGKVAKVMYLFPCKKLVLDEGDALQEVIDACNELGKDSRWMAEQLVYGANITLKQEVKPTAPAKRGGVRVDDSMAKFLAAIAAGNTNALALVAKVSTKEVSMQQAAAAFAAE